MRRALGGVLHALGDLAAHADDRDLLFVMAFAVGSAGSGFGRRTLCQVGLKVLVQNTSSGTCALNQA
ncbi:hypothetical protein D3C86_2185660 [compost metagenome]